jgi:hypothetical protein
MQQVRPNREPAHETAVRGSGGGITSAPGGPRTELSSLLNNYNSSQQHCMYIYIRNL